MQHHIVDKVALYEAWAKKCTSKRSISMLVDDCAELMLSARHPEHSSTSVEDLVGRMARVCVMSEMIASMTETDLDIAKDDKLRSIAEMMGLIYRPSKNMCVEESKNPYLGYNPGGWK